MACERSMSSSSTRNQPVTTAGPDADAADGCGLLDPAEHQAVRLSTVRPAAGVRLNVVAIGVARRGARWEDVYATVEEEETR